MSSTELGGGKKPFGLHSRIARLENCVSSEVAGETVILQLDSGQYFGLNESASLVWNALSQPRTLVDLTQVLLAEYCVEGEIARADLTTALATMEHHGLIGVLKDDIEFGVVPHRG